MNAGSKLTIADSFQVSGTTTLTSGTIVLNSAVNIPALTYNALTLAANSGTYNLLGNIATNNLFSKTASGSTLNLGANTLTINTDLYVVGDVTGTGKIFIDRPIGGFATLSGNGNLNNLEVSVAGGGLRITDTVLVNGSLIFTAGGLTLRTGSKLSIGTNVSSTGNIVTTAGSNLYAQPGSHFGIFGNGASSPISNLSINCAGTFTLDYPKGISLGANMSLSGPTNMVNGKLDQNGFNLDLGAISNTNFSLNTTNGRFTNLGATGYLRINGAVGSPAINGIKIDSVAFASVAYPSGVSIDSSIYVKSFWAISNGKVNLNGSNIILSSSASISEQPGMVFFGATGSITTTRNIAAAVTSMTNIAGLGLRITTSAAPGVTTLVRKHNVLTNNGNSSIKRNFSLTVSSPITLGNIEIVYDSTEINGLNRSRLKMNKLASSVWSKIGTGASSNNATPTGWLASSNQSVSGTVVFTASDSSNSLSPVFINPDMSAGVSANASINAVYPNPFSEQFTVDLNASENSNATIQLFDIHGKLVFNQRYPVVMGQNLVHLKTAELASGVYLISVLNNQEVRTFRIVKQ